MPGLRLSGSEGQIVEEILTDIKGAQDRLLRAAKKWVNLSERTRGRVIEATPASYREFWSRLDRVGRGELHPQLANVGGLPARYLGRLPVDEQERYLRDLIPVAVTVRNKPDVLLVDVAVMSSRQRAQVFKVAGQTVHVRSVAEQRAWLADQEQRRLAREEMESGLARVERPGRWTVEKGKVWIAPEKVESGLTKRDMLTMLRDLGA